MGRKWGQHFLRSQATIDKILSASGVDKDSLVLEIGPGEGVLTYPLCQRAKEVHAFEIDPSLASKLEQSGVPNLVVHRGDFLKSEPQTDLGGSSVELHVVANLPYYITAPILERLAWQRSVQVRRAVLMMQEEVALRICHPASRSAGALTYIVGAYFDAEYLFKVPPGCFSPPPKVDSAVLALTPRSRESSPSLQEHKTYESLVSTAFRTRRKQLGSSLKSLRADARLVLESSGIDPKRRPETLSVQEFWTLTRKWQHSE